MKMSRFTHWIAGYHSKGFRPGDGIPNQLQLTSTECFTILGKRRKIKLIMKYEDLNYQGNLTGWWGCSFDIGGKSWCPIECVSIGDGPVGMLKQIRRNLSMLLYQEYFDTLPREERRSIIPHEEHTETKEFKKHKAKVYLAANRTARILGYKIHQKLMQLNQITKEEHIDISKACFRCFPALIKGSHLRSMGTTYLIALRKHGEEGLYAMILSDIKKYSPGMAREVLDRVIQKKIRNFTAYHHLIAAIPSIYSKCKYNLPLPEEGRFYDKLKYIPKNRYEWFMSLAVFGQIRGHRHGITGREQHMQPESIVKFVKSSIKLWRAFRKVTDTKERYSVKRLHMMLQYIADGHTMYSTLQENDQGIHFAEITGSPSRMLKNAIYNHNQELHIDRLKLMDTPNADMCEPVMELPEWIEKYRVKTHHDLVMAGKECRNCIGGYTQSGDIFVRKGNVCAQVSNRDLRVVQVYDQHNTRTLHSEIMEKKLNKSLAPLRVVLEKRLQIA